MSKRSPRQAKSKMPQFDAAPLDEDEDEDACPIPDENGDVILRSGGRKPKKKSRKPKGKPAR